MNDIQYKMINQYILNNKITMSDINFLNNLNQTLDKTRLNNQSIFYHPHQTIYYINEIGILLFH